MRGKFELLMVIAVLYPLGISAQGISDIVDGLESIGCWHARADYSITLPQATDDVVYTVVMESSAAPADTLAPADYLIEWGVDTPSGRSEGFSAYFDGHHYRFRDERLQEYHWEWDSIPFMPRRVGAAYSNGVHRSAQFVDLLPHFIASDLRRMASDSLYTLTVHPDTVVSGHRCAVVDAVMTVQGYVCSEVTYTFDAASMLPLAVEADYNPGALSEQTVSVSYGYGSDALSADCTELSERFLIGRYPAVFEKYRQSNFRIENLPGTRMPGFALPTTTGERYSRHAGDPFRVPTVIVLLEAGSEFTPQLIAGMREAVDRMPVDADVIYAFADNRIDDIDAVLAAPRQGEHILMSAGPLARDCGVAAMPVVIVCGRSGDVADVRVGYNKDLPLDVIQMTVLAD